MIICHAFNFIFIKTRKTASTSMEIALSKFCGADDVITRINPKDESTRAKLGYRGRQNDVIPFSAYTADDWKHLLARRRRRLYYNHAPATFIRRHVDPDVWNSYFKFCFDRNPFDRIVSEYYFHIGQTGESLSLEEFVRTAPDWKLTNYPLYSKDQEIIVDHVARYEDLLLELEKIAERLGLPESIDLPRAKTGFRKDAKPLDQIIDEASRRRILKSSHAEIELLGYSSI